MRSDRTGSARVGAVLVAALATAAVAAPACRKDKEQQPVPTVGGPIDVVPAAPLAEAGPAEPVAAQPEAEAGAPAEARPRPPGGLFAGLLGGGAGTNAGTPKAPGAADASALRRLLVAAKRTEPAATTAALQGVDIPPDDPRHPGTHGSIEQPPVPVEPPSEGPSGAEVPCETLVPSLFACLADEADLDIGPDAVKEAVEECKRDFAAYSQEERATLVGCNDIAECDAKVLCIVGVVGGQEEEEEGDEGPDDLLSDPGSEPGEGLGDLFGQAPDPARVATLAPDVRALCGQMASKMDACWESLVGLVGGEVDEETRETMALARPMVRAGMENICLTAALDAPDTLGEIRAAQECFAMPCDRMMDCIADAEQRLEGTPAGDTTTDLP